MILMRGNERLAE